MRNINSFFESMWRNLKDAGADKTKLKNYHEVYGNCETLPMTSLSLTVKKRFQQKIISSYIMSSHNLETEKGRWSNTPKTARVCKQCTSKSEETLQHFINECDRFNEIRNRNFNFPTSLQLSEFFNLPNCKTILEDLHTRRR